MTACLAYWTSVLKTTLEIPLLGVPGLNMINGDVYGKIPLSDKTTLHVSARRSMADILETPTYKQYFDRAFRDTEVINSQSVNNNRVITTDQNFYFYDFSAKFLYDITDRDKVRVNFINVYNKIDYLETTENNTDFEAKTSGLIQKILPGRLAMKEIGTNASLQMPKCIFHCTI